ncbi:GNAT family N-acetyltransferase [Zobellella endophytica]|uniref:GNAT family N-acetyltransferase n=1 Tax=Zobellella endophytica TaxID=2116700 RepID=A0A2P7RBA1_9GAMM|nr:GNAT family N-acetyltransferase [Zobellella endophytica]PSJ47507.1 GNAT family N-acetyltransferase [Zobellella endophytica]
MSLLSIEPITEAAWPQILALQARCYQELAPESEAVLRSKWRASPATCLQCRDQGGALLGYLLSHPWPHAGLPALHREYEIAGPSDRLYLHDLAVSPRAHGLGVGKGLVAALLDRARAQGFARVSLVSVQGSEGFWARFGFRPLRNAELCASYGDDPRAMALEL